jgi:tetratricopeptide (TPR) repeat protein
MSVINQMLRDLDARGQGDAASRRAAMASVGEVASLRAPAWRSRRLWWLMAAVMVALALTVIVLLANRWQAIERAAEAGTRMGAPPPALAEPASEIETVVAADAVAVAPAAPQEANVVPVPTLAPVPAAAPVPAPPVVSPERPAAVAADLQPEPVASPAPAPAARATIERVATAFDPLDAARSALAEGRAEAALAALAAQPEAGAERDALAAAALQQLGRHAEAEQAYRRALRREPDVGAWWAGLGISLETSGRGDEALAAFREAQRRGPLDPALADYLGERVEALSAGEPSR